MSTDLILEAELISPEGLEVAQSYIAQKGNMELTAEAMQLPVEQVQRHLNSREVKDYINKVYNEGGFRNRFKMGAVMDAIIEQKLEEMDETGLGSDKDIVEILQMVHKMKMDAMAMEIKLEEARSKAPSHQTNVQVNNVGGDGYNSLLETLIGS